MNESQNIEKKSFRLIAGNNPDWNSIARECVGFANARGGKLIIGIEDNSLLPPLNQSIKDSLVEKSRKTIPQRTINVRITVKKTTATNGGEYMEISVFSSRQTVASTTDGRYFIRVADECRPVLPDDLPRLFTDKDSYIWETQTTKKIPAGNCDLQKYNNFIALIHSSDRVSEFVKEKSNDEILSYYFLTGEKYLTNLGVLFIGQQKDRAMLLNSPIIQFIKYDEQEVKINKIIWDDFNLNPYELIDDVLTKIPDWQEGVEISEGMFRNVIPNYDKTVIRELLVNALVHRPYTTRGDIFINLFPDRLEFHNPGLLPLGVTPNNILHQSVRRNENLAKVFFALRLMEREGSGYDLIYEKLLSNGKPVPLVTEGNDRVTVTIKRQITDPNIVRLLNRLNERYQLKQKEIISLGLVAQHTILTAFAFRKILELRDKNETRHWLGRLQKLNIIHTQGRTKGLEYFINPKIMRETGFTGPTNLKKIEPYRLRELIVEDLSTYHESSISEIQQRIGNEISLTKIRNQLKKLIHSGIVTRKGEKRYTRYLFNKSV